MEEDPTDHQRRVRQVLEGNERVWFHPKKELLAVWYGGARIKIVNSQTYQEMEVVTVPTANREIHEIEDAVCVALARRGFDRVGRAQDDTRVVQR